MAAAFDFIALQTTLKALGFYDFVLPWLFAFAIVFGVLEKAAIFTSGDGTNKKTNKGIESLLALAVAFYVTLFTPVPGFLSSFFTKLYGGSVVVLAGSLAILLFLGMFGFNLTELFIDNKKLKLGGIILLLLLIAIGVIIFINAGGGVFGMPNLSFIGSSEWITLIVFFAVIAFAMWYAVSGGGNTATGKPPGT